MVLDMKKYWNNETKKLMTKAEMEAAIEQKQEEKSEVQNEVPDEQKQEEKSEEPMMGEETKPARSRSRK